jgi:hypothetical protein
MVRQMVRKPFTPGPWIAHEEILTPGGLHVSGRSPSVRKGNHVVAAVNRFLDERLNHALCDEAEANAFLIAAAPEMYDALNRVVEESKADGVVSVSAIENAAKVIERAAPTIPKIREKK